MKIQKLVSILSASALLVASAHAFTPVLYIDVDSSLEAGYDETAGGPSTPYGAGHFEYTVDPGSFIDPSFSLSEVYYWTLDLGFSYAYSYTNSLDEVTSGGGANPAYPFPDHLEGFASVEDLTALLGLSPLELLFIWDALPGSGTLEDLLLAYNSIPFLPPVDTDPFDEIDSGDISYTSSFGLDSGEIDFELNAPLEDIDNGGYYKSASLLVHSDLTVAAFRVPDTGTTSILAIASFGLLLAARRRIRA